MRMVRAELGGMVAALAAAFLPIQDGRSSGGATYEVVAFTDQEAPGGEAFSWLSAPRIGNGGDLVFPAYLQDESSLLVAGKPGNFRRVVLSGDSVPEGGGTFSYFGDPSISSEGYAAFPAYVYGESDSGGESLWAETASGLALVKESDGGTLGGAAYRGAPVLAAKESAGTGETPAALYAGEAGSMAPILEEGSPAPGFSNGAKISEVFGSSGSGVFEDAGTSVDMNESGVLVTKAIVTATPSQTPISSDVLYAGDRNELRILASTGAEAPGIADTVIENLSSRPSVSSNGHYAFAATLSGSASSAVFAGADGDLRLIVKSSDLVPTTSDVYFKAFDQAAVNAAGDVVFGATILYPNETTRYGIWVKRESEEPVLLAISGIDLPTPSGTAEVDSVEFAGPGTFNDLNQFVFQAYTSEGAGIYLADTRPGTPWIRLRKPADRREQVTTARRVKIAGVVTDDTGVASVDVKVVPRSSRKEERRKTRSARVVRRSALAKDGKNWSVQIPLAMGRNRVSITATDKLGNVSDPLTFTMLRYRCADR